MAFTITTLIFQENDYIGGGGEGEVWKSTDLQLNATIAVKKVPLHLFGGNQAAFFQEARMLYDSRHPNVVEVKYGCLSSDYVYLAMPYYQKGSLMGIIQTRMLTTREIVKYSLDFLSGLNHIHTKRLIHFDVKLENILISDSNDALLADFGVAQYTRLNGFSANQGTTDRYAPPEHFIPPNQHDLKFDIYQAGLAIYRMCNGEQDFLDQFHAAFLKRGVSSDQNFFDSVLKGSFPDRSSFLPHIPSRLRKAVKRALEVDRSVRYDTVLEMINDICKVEDLLDWQYSNQNGDMIWEMTREDGKPVVVKLWQNSQGWHIETKMNNRLRTPNSPKNMSLVQRNSELLRIFKEEESILAT